MSIFRRLDDWIIDCIFQPISDALARWVSCYGIAEFLWTGVVLSRLALFVHDQERYWISILFMIPWAVWYLIDCHREDMKPPSATLPVFRIRLFGMRCSWLVLAPIDALSVVFAETGWERLQAISWFAVYAACWFMACRRNPPKPARAPMVIDAKAATS